MSPEIVERTANISEKKDQRGNFKVSRGIQRLTKIAAAHLETTVETFVETAVRDRLRRFAEQLPPNVRESVANSGDAPVTNPEVTPVTNRVLPANEPTEAGEIPNISMLQSVHPRHEWEHRAVDTILDIEEYAEAFRVNIRAVHLLATGREPDVGTPVANAGPKPLPGGKMEEVHQRVGNYEQTYGALQKRVPRPAPGRKGGRKPQTGTD